MHEYLNRSRGTHNALVEGRYIQPVLPLSSLTKDDDISIFHIVTLPNFLPIILEFWLLALSNLFLEMYISVEYMIHFYLKFKCFPLYTGI